MNIVKRNAKARAVVNSSIERHPVPVLGIDYKVKIVYKNIKITEVFCFTYNFSCVLRKIYQYIRENDCSCKISGMFYGYTI